MLLHKGRAVLALLLDERHLLHAEMVRLVALAVRYYDIVRPNLPDRPAAARQLDPAELLDAMRHVPAEHDQHFHNTLDNLIARNASPRLYRSICSAARHHQR